MVGQEIPNYGHTAVQVLPTHYHQMSVTNDPDPSTLTWITSVFAESFKALEMFLAELPSHLDNENLFVSKYLFLNQYSRKLNMFVFYPFLSSNVIRFLFTMNGNVWLRTFSCTLQPVSPHINVHQGSGCHRGNE